MSIPSSPSQHPVEVYSSPPSKRTRTVAIIKSHALDHRFDIEMRISEAGFEIVKERQMEFDIETDPDTMYDLFGEDYVCFAEGPVWVYVLERRRAVEVWHTLMGDADPDIARQETSNSLRALYGLSREQNGLMGAPDVQTAEDQIQAIFASSPPFPLADLPDVSNAAYPQSPQYYSESGTLQNTNGSQRSRSSSGGNASGKGDKPQFKARALPVTHVAPDIVPRMSRAAALRAGIKDETTQPRRHQATAESIAKTFANVPGHKRAESIAVASTAPPTIAPRMTRAASLRLGQPVAPTPARVVKPKEVRPKTADRAPAAATFDGVPGHKRRESIAVASTKPPTVAPRTNRSATLRVKKEAAPPSAFNLRTGSNTVSRSSSRASLDLPGNSRPTFSRPASAASVRATSTAPRPSSSFGSKPLKGSTEVNKQAGTATADAPTKPKPRVSVAAPPTIAPRTNRSALLRAAKMGTAAVTNAVKAPAKMARAVKA